MCGHQVSVVTPPPPSSQGPHLIIKSYTCQKV